MSQMLKLNQNEDAVSPIVAEILMVAIGIIIAAIIVASVFGIGSTEVAPQAAMRIADVDVANNVVTISHQGGESIDLSDTAIIISQGSSITKYDPVNVTSGTLFESGAVLVIDTDDGTGSLNGIPVLDATGTSLTITRVSDDVVVKAVDIPSSQVFADMSYNV